MDIQILIVQKYEAKTMYLAYYDFFERLYGKNVLNNLSKKALIKGVVDSYHLSFLDSNYASAVKTVDESFINDGEKHPIMLGAYDENGQMVAVCRVVVGIPTDKSNALVSEIILLNKDMPMEACTDLYSVIVSKLEELIKSSFADISLVTFEVPIADDAFIVAARENGYIIDEDQAQGYFTCLFDKRVRKNNKVLILENQNAPTE